MMLLLFHRETKNPTEHVQNKSHHSSVCLFVGFECVTIAPLLDKQDSCLVEVTELDLTNIDGTHSVMLEVRDTD